jgi:hypothetical protein
LQEKDFVKAVKVLSEIQDSPQENDGVNGTNAALLVSALRQAGRTEEAAELEKKTRARYPRAPL